MATTDDLPSAVQYGYAAGRYLLAVGDTTADLDRKPDSVAPVGTIKFRPLTGNVPIAGTPAVGVLPQIVTCSINADGDIVDPTGSVGVWLIAGTYEVAFSFTGVTIPTFQMDVEPTNDLANPAWVPLEQPLIPGPTQVFVVNEAVYTETLAARDQIVGLADSLTAAADNIDINTAAAVSAKTAAQTAAATAETAATSAQAALAAVPDAMTAGLAPKANWLSARPVMTVATTPQPGFNIYSATTAVIVNTLPLLSQVNDSDTYVIEKYSLDVTGSPAVQAICAGADTLVGGANVVTCTLPGSQRHLTRVSIAGAYYWKVADTVEPLSETDKRYGKISGLNAPAPANSDFWQFPTAAAASVQINAGASRVVTCTAPNGDNYAVWWDAQFKPIIGRWNSLTRNWATFDLSTVPGNPMGIGAVDLHNSLSVIVDGAGYIHIWGNHHDNHLRYARSANPNDFTSWTFPGMVGTNEDRVTYPKPLPLPDGGLLFAYRNGESGNGDEFLDRYSITTRKWTRVGMIFKGTAPVSPDESAYPCTLLMDSAGVLYWWYIWRSDDTATSSHDMGCIKSTDLGVSWQTLSGTPISLPLTPSNTAPVVLGGAGTPTGLISGGTPSIDANGVTHMAKWLGASGGWTLHHYYFSGGAWHDDSLITNVQGGTAPTCWSNGSSTWAIYSKNSRVTAVRMYPTLGAEVDLFPVPVNQWEGTTDPTVTSVYRSLVVPANSALTAGSWAGVMSLTPAALNGTAPTDIWVQPVVAATVPVTISASQQAMIPGFYYTPDTGPRTGSSMSFSQLLDCRGAELYPGNLAHIASMIWAHRTAGAGAPCQTKGFIIEMLTPVSGVIRAVTPLVDASVSGLPEPSVENALTPSNLLPARSYILALQWVTGTSSPTVTSIPSTAIGLRNTGQATGPGAMSTTNFAGYSISAPDGSSLPTSAAVGDFVKITPTSNVPLVGVKVTAAP